MAFTISFLASLRPRLARPIAALALAAGLAACGLGRGNDSGGIITDPIVAASVNGRDIYVEDVHNHAIAQGYLREGEDLDANSDAFFQALEELIEMRLLSEEAESRGLDRQADIRRQLELARERVLAGAIYEEIRQKGSDPRAVEGAYRENVSRLGQGEEIRLRHIQFESRDAALAAKRRLDNGERFEALAFELSTDRQNASEGGELGFMSVPDLPEPIQQLTEGANVGVILGPVRTDTGWHLFRVEDRRQRGAPSLETLRPRIIEWLTFQEHRQLVERLESNASIERLRAPDAGVEPGGDLTAPADRPSAAPEAPAVAEAPDGEAPLAAAGPRTPPPFPFPMGPGGVYGHPSEPEPATPAPAARPAPAQAAGAVTPTAAPARVENAAAAQPAPTP